MFIPKEAENAFNQFSGPVFKPGRLDGKTKELVAVAVSVMADCVPCIKHHYQGALAAGADQEEIAEAIAVAMAICAGSKRAKYASVIAEL